MPGTWREQHVVDATAKVTEIPAPLICERKLMGIDLRPDLPRMRRQDQNAGANDDGLLDRMGDEEDGRPGAAP
jgi:hypothetical protein